MSEYIFKGLQNLKDEENAKFQQKLTPGVPEDKFLGVRVPLCRKLAKDLMKNNPVEAAEFREHLPHDYFDENMLHGLMIAEIRDYDQCIEELDRFLPYIDNWAVCDSLSPVVLKKNHEKLIVKCREWISSKDIYTIRFGMLMMMKHFLEEDFDNEYLQLVCKVSSDEYYINMMRAWYFATALAKQWEDTIPFITEKRLDDWTHNKTIQKAKESYRITKEQKEYLQSYKVSVKIDKSLC